MTSRNKFQERRKEKEKQVSVAFLVSDHELTFHSKPKDVTLSYYKQTLHVITCAQNVLERTNLLPYIYSFPKSFPISVTFMSANADSTSNLNCFPILICQLPFPSSFNPPFSPICSESPSCLSLKICNPFLLPSYSFVSLCALNFIG